ncbi:MAG: DUF4134 domain-containing protein [Bacteroides sp.]|nr:DUF4134 domain-containing protein [Bacteroides sp.]MCM1531461.1 DUF4134 domain-containing protein [Ruminococcus flavefaciens]MCM1554377.1 DUF4134 domain-containing protein [Bacteroides sp.]
MKANRIKLFAVAAMAALPVFSMAQSGSQAKSALTQVTSELKGIFETVSTLALIIAALVAIVGAIMVFAKIQQGDQQAAKTIGGWFGAVLFVSLAIGIVIKAFFL